MGAISMRRCVPGRMIRSIFLVLGMFSSFVLPHQTRANQLTNGDFENPNLGTSGFQFDTTVIPGWSVINTVALTTTGCCFAAFSGHQDIDLVGTLGNGGLQQTFATTPGQEYELTFAFARNYTASLFPFGPQITSASASITVTSSLLTPLLLDSVTDSSVGGTGTNPNWQIYTGFFTADSASTALRILNTVGGFNGGIYLDDVSI